MANVDYEVREFMLPGLEKRGYKCIKEVIISDKEIFRIFNRENIYSAYVEDLGDAFYDAVRNNPSALIEILRLSEWRENFEDDGRDTKGLDELSNFLYDLSFKTCKCGCMLEYQGDLAAPGKGQSWKCTECDSSYHVMGKSVRPFDSIDPDSVELKPWEVE